MQNDPKVEIPLNELWKHEPFINTESGIEPKAFPQDRDYLQERVKLVVTKSLEATITLATDKILQEVLRVVSRMDSKQREQYLLKITAGLPRDLPKWVCDMMHTEIRKFDKRILNFTDLTKSED